MSGPCRTCCSVVPLGRSTKGSGIRLSRRLAGLTAGLSTCHVLALHGACPTLSNEKNLPTFHYAGWLIGILIMVDYNPYIAG